MGGLWVLLVHLAHSPMGIGAFGGFTSAIAVDLHAWVKFNDWSGFATYNWKIATFRWAGGFVTGALTGAGYGALIQ